MDDYFLPKPIAIILRIVYGIFLYWLICFIPIITIGYGPGHIIRLALFAFLVWLTKKILCSKVATITIGCFLALAIVWLCLNVNKQSQPNVSPKTDVELFSEIYEKWGPHPTSDTPTVSPEELQKIFERFNGTPTSTPNFTSTPRPIPTASPTPEITPAPTDTPVPTFDYTLVAHKKSKVFHHPLCETVQYIPESSREYFTCSSSSLIDQGYHPCSQCHGEEYTVPPYIQPAALRVPTAAPRKTATYIANTSTGKFHKPSCASVSQMKNSNKRTYTCTRDEMLYMGYDPCQRCHP